MSKPASASFVASADRLERLPITGYYVLLLIIACLAWLCESYDIGVIGSALPALHKLWDMSPAATGTLVASSTFGVVIGVVPAGYLSDLYGKKRMMVLSMAWFAVFTALCGFSTSWQMLASLRFIAGLGLGAMFPLPYTIITEFTPKRIRGAATPLLDSVLSMGYFVTPLLAAGLITVYAPEALWRIMFFIGGLPLLYAVIVQLVLPESPRWLEVRGRTAEADRIVTELERRAEASTGRPLPPVERSTPIVHADRPPLAELWSRAYLKRTIMLWIVFGGSLVIFYAIIGFMPSVLVKEGFDFGKAFFFAALINGVAIPTKWFLAWFIEAAGRRAVIVTYILLAAVGAIIVGLAHDPKTVIIGAAIAAGFGTAAPAAVKVYGAELYPTRIRTFGVSFMEGVARLVSGVIAPYVFALLLSGVGVAGSFFFVAILSLIAVVAVLALGTETKGLQLEDASEMRDVRTGVPVEA